VVCSSLGCTYCYNHETAFTIPNVSVDNFKDQTQVCKKFHAANTLAAQLVL